VATCGRKEKRQYEIEHGLNLGRRRKEKRSARIRNLLDLKDNSPEHARNKTLPPNLGASLKRPKRREAVL
jgi:hypothetical protein